MPTLRYYVKQGHSGPGVALPDIARFLINDHPTLTGPGWTIVEAQSGANREVPSDPTDMDSLVSATGWPNGSLAVGDWIVLESANANNTNHFQLYMEYNATTSYNFMLIPFEDFATGGGAASPPTFPSTAFGTAGALFNFSTFNHFAAYTVVADEGMIMLLLDGLDVDLRFTYMGEVDGIDVRDPRAYVVRDGETIVGHTNSGWDRLSPFDNITFITGVPVLFGSASSGNPMHDINAGRMFDVDYVHPVAVWFQTSQHIHFAGWLRGCYAMRFPAPNDIIITADKRFLVASNTVSDPAIAIRWNEESY